MAELERLANHLGDIGAICNDASFSLLHAECGILRERVLRATQACFGHRLMMDRVVPGGVADDVAPDGVAQLSVLVETLQRRFPELIEIYDNTASLQDRTVGTGHLRPELARAFGAGLFEPDGTHRPSEPTLEDRALWAAECHRVEMARLNRHADHRAAESRAVDALSIGLIPRDVAEYIARTSLVGHDD